MAAFDLQRTAHGWLIKMADIVIEAASPRLEQGVVHATLSVSRDQTIVYRNSANLTSERTRVQIIKRLGEKGVKLDERVLLALDEACRQYGERRDQRLSNGPTNFSGTVPLDLLGLKSAFERWLLIVDEDFLPVLAGAFLAHRLGGEPVWLLIVAPPGGTKSEPLRTLYGYPGVYPLSDLTARTFASGLDTAAGDASLLSRLFDEILVLKDFTTVLEMHRDERQAILAQLREIYDGRFDKAWGTGRELHWEGRLGFIAGVTPIIDRHQAVLSVLGERFILFRVVLPDRVQLATKALETANHEVAMRSELAAAMHGFIAARSSVPPTVDQHVIATLATVADFVTRARSGVVRDGYRRELEYAPEPEAPTRFAKVLLALASGIALAFDDTSVSTRELQLVLRVALDCLPVVRQRVIAALVRGTIAADGDTLSTADIAGAAQFSTTSIRRCLEDLQALAIVTCHKTGAGKADEWDLLPHFAGVFRDLIAASARVGRSSFSGTVADPADDGTSADRARNVAEGVPELSELVPDASSAARPSKPGGLVEEAREMISL